MKNSNILALSFLFFMCINCKAQNPILDISDSEGTNSISGAYYKDINNVLNPFVGTYLYTNGTTSLKIVLQKKEMSSINGRYYEDLIIGEYQYIENGVEKLNTLNNLNTTYTNGWKYSINGNFILIGKSLGCDACDPNEKRLQISMFDRTISRAANLDIRRIVLHNQPAIKIFIRWTLGNRAIKEGTPPPTAPKIPNGEYVLIKQ